MDYANKLGFYWGMTTNGMLIDEEIVKKMEETGMYSISVSIDGLKETHESFRKVPGSFDKILKGIDLMLHSPSIQIVQVTTVVNKKNIDELEDIYNLMKQINIKYWRILNVDPIGRARDNKEILLDGKEFQRMLDFIREKRVMFENKQSDINVEFGCAHFLGVKEEPLIRTRQFICITGIIVGSILSNGDIFVCPDVPRRPELIQGNIRKDSFPEVWEKKYKPFRKVSRTSNSKCKNCPDWKKCMGGAFHTWDFDEKRQLFCARDLFKEEFKLEKKENRKKKNK
jgi:radical SAM protein with 4Fe4S-binding SPASM domain